LGLWYCASVKNALEIVLSTVDEKLYSLSSWKGPGKVGMERRMQEIAKIEIEEYLHKGRVQ